MIRLLMFSILAAAAFETASVRPGKTVVGHDGTVVVTPLRYRRNQRYPETARLGRVRAEGKGGAKLNRPVRTATWKFHGTLDEFADRLATQLAIPILNDPTVPSHPAGPAIPILNKTGLNGIYDLAVDFNPEPGADLFTLWQRVLQEQLGLRLESHSSALEMLVIDHAEKPDATSN